MKDVQNKFIRYAKINTRSDEMSETTPSTERQFVLAKLLRDELKALGLEVTLDEHCYLFATLPSNLEEERETLGLLAHLDTADFNSENVEPIVTLYEGGDLVLNEEENIVMKVADFPMLKNYVGETLIHTNGLTLLGADDKAGIAEIMTVIEYLVKHPEVKHPRIRIAFTPDEEIGRGTECFDVEAFGADVAYTVDGGPVGELEYENFNAASARIHVQGRNVHPGSAKDKMINAVSLAAEFHTRLPKDMVPEKTEGYEGFIHLTSLQGTEEEADLSYIIRDHDHKLFEEKKALVEKLVKERNEELGKEILTLTMKDSYYNMREKIEPVMYLIDRAKRAMEACDVEPIIQPIRGGTDGAQLSYKGLPCPNLFTGGENYHGRYEFISVESMVKSVEVLLRLVEIFAE
ncbi:peptidase T [Guggenheimella bovis]